MRYTKILLFDFQKARMEKTIDTVRTNFNSIRTGRANPAMLDKIEVGLIYRFALGSFKLQ